MFSPRFLTFLILLFFTTVLVAQPVLGPSIAEESLPDDTTPICDIPLELDVEINDGPDEGDLIPDFTLYDLSGNSYQMQEIMADGKPVLLIGASYSCFVFRNKVELINDLVDAYEEDLNVFVVYTVEAHPYGDISPYYGFENTGEQNFADGVLVPQASTYGERKETALAMMEDVGLTATLLLDNPCNEWWQAYGSSPNNAYVIQPDGIVFDAQTWLDRYPEDIHGSLAGLFGEDITGEPVPNGVFTIPSYDDTCVAGAPGSTIIAHINLQANDEAASYLDIYKLNEDIPGSWTTSICTDVCYPPSTDLVNMFVEQSTTPALSFYFYTTLSGSEGEVNLLVKNVFVPTNSYNLLLKACTGVESTELEATITKSAFYIYPNPASTQLSVFLAEYPDSLVDVSLLDVRGRPVKTWSQIATQFGDVPLPVQDVEAGYYFLQVTGKEHSGIQPVIIQ